MSATFRKRFDMMDFLGSCQPSGFPAFLAQWMFCQIPVADLPPCPPIPALAGRIALVLIVMRRNDLLVFLAIPARYQPGTTWIRTGALRLIRHRCRLLPDRKKAPAVYSAKASLFSFVAIVILPDFYSVFLCLLVSSLRLM